MNKTSILILLLLLSSFVTAQTGGSRGSRGTPDVVATNGVVNGPHHVTLAAGQSGAAGQLWLYTIPEEEIATAQTYGFSFWLRPSYTYPNPPVWAQAYGNNAQGLAAWTEKNNGEFRGSARGDRALCLYWLRGNWGPQRGFPAFHTVSYQMNNNDANQQIRYPNREDFDGKWVFVHASYSTELLSARVWTYFANSNSQLGVVWNNNNKRPNQQLKFRLGTADNGDIPGYNFQYSQVKIFYGPQSMNFFLNSEADFLAYKDATPFNTVRNTENDQVNIIIGNEPVTRTVANTELAVTEFTGLDAVPEYAVYGWCRWTSTRAKVAWHNIYRLSPFSAGDTENAAKVGDRQIVAWVGNGYLHFATSTFAYFRGNNVNMHQNINYGQNLESWFFVYQGYSFAQKKNYVYVKWASTEGFVVFNDVYHQLPDRATFWLGKDQWHASFNGDMKQWKVHFGVGAYRTTGFEELYQLEPPPTFQLAQRSDAGELIESPQRVTVPAYFVDVPAAELPEVTGDYAYAFWYRVNNFYPNRMNLGMERSQYHTLAFLSDTNSQGQGIGDRTLAIWYTPSNGAIPIYHTSTYGTTPANGNHWRNVPLTDYRDYDSHWNFVYFGFERETSQVFFYAYHSRAGNVLTQDWTGITHVYPKPRFTFTLGGKDYPGINGHYFNPQFWYTGRSFMGSREAVDEYRENRVTRPSMLLAPERGQHTLVEAEQTVVGNTNQAPKNTYNTLEAAGAEEYAIYGWFRWSSFDKGGWPNLFRVSQVGQADGSDLRNSDQMGDRTFCIWVNGNGNIYPASYTSGVNGGDNWNAYVAKPFQDDLESWFWVYLGYSNVVNKVFFFVKWFDRDDSWSIDAAKQKLPYRLHATVGGEGQWHQSFSGSIKDVHLVWGPGAFRDTNFGELQAIPEDASSGVEVDNTWDTPAMEISASNTQRANDLLEVVVPAEELSSIVEYSFSFWFRHSYEDPSLGDLGNKRGSYTGLAGITERDSWEDMSAPGGRSLSLWLTPETDGRNFHASTYATNRNNNNHWQNQPFPDLIDYDSVWNFVYFGYSIALQKAFFYVKFGQSQQIRSLEWAQTAHLAPLAALKFNLGAPQGSSLQTMNGRYFDVRFRWDNLAFKGSEGNVEWYLSNSVARPTQLNPQSSFRLTNGLVTRVQDDAPAEFQYPSQLNGARAYAIWGWAKWTQPANLAGWNNLFRVTIQPNAQATNMGQVGSRALCLWYNAPGRFLHIRNYRFGTPGGDVVNDGPPNHPAPEIDQWFFVYQGYSVDQKKHVFFVKFATTEWIDVMEDFVQKVPRYIGVYMGRDNYHSGWNGQLKGWNFGTGDSNFLDNDFDELMNRPITNDLEMGGNEQFFTSHRNSRDGNDGPVHVENIADDELPTTLKAQAWTWFQWAFNSPSSFGNPSVARGKCYHIARLAYSGANSLQANLCFNNDGIASVQFIDNSGDGAPVQRIIELPDEQDLDRWNFVYLHHDDQAHRSVAVVKFQRTGTKVLVTFEDRNWNLPSDILGLRVSGVNGDNYKFNGFFFDAQVSNSQTLGVVDEADFNRVFDEVTVDPDTFDPPRDQPDDVPEVALATLEPSGVVRTNPRTANTPTKNIGTQSRANAYNLFGWVRWTGTSGIAQQANEWTLVYRQSQKTHEDLQDEQNPGDRTFALFVSSAGQLKTSTYDFRSITFTARNRDQAVDLAQLSEWFFVYHAFNRATQKVYFALRLADGTVIQQTESNVKHLRSNDNSLYLGKDKFADYNAWSGEFRSFQAQSQGPVFVDTPEALQQFADQAVPPEPPLVIVLDEPLLAPEGDCIILYTECDYQGTSVQFCDQDPNTDIVVQSIYIPEGWVVTLYENEQYEGRSSEHTESVPCLENGVDFRMLMQSSMKVKKVGTKIHHKKSHLNKNRKL